MSKILFRNIFNDVLIALVIGLAFWAGLLYYIIHFVAETSKPVQETQIEVPENIFSITGPIKEIGQDFIKIEAEPKGNIALTETTVIKVNIDKNTDFIKVIFPSQLPALEEGEGKSFLQRKKISFNDLSIDQEVVAVSSENIKGKQEFLADRIEVTGDR